MPRLIEEVYKELDDCIRSFRIVLATLDSDINAAIDKERSSGEIDPLLLSKTEKVIELRAQFEQLQAVVQYRKYPSHILMMGINPIRDRILDFRSVWLKQGIDRSFVSSSIDVFDRSFYGVFQSLIRAANEHFTTNLVPHFVTKRWSSPTHERLIEENILIYAIKLIRSFLTANSYQDQLAKTLMAFLTKNKTLETADCYNKMLVKIDSQVRSIYQQYVSACPSLPPEELVVKVYNNPVLLLQLNARVEAQKELEVAKTIISNTVNELKLEQSLKAFMDEAEISEDKREQILAELRNMSDIDISDFYASPREGSGGSRSLKSRFTTLIHKFIELVLVNKEDKLKLAKPYFDYELLDGDFVVAAGVFILIMRLQGLLSVQRMITEDFVDELQEIRDKAMQKTPRATRFHSSPRYTLPASTINTSQSQPSLRDEIQEESASKLGLQCSRRNSIQDKKSKSAGELTQKSSSVQIPKIQISKTRISLATSVETLQIGSVTPRSSMDFSVMTFERYKELVRNIEIHYTTTASFLGLLGSLIKLIRKYFFNKNSKSSNDTTPAESFSQVLSCLGGANKQYTAVSNTTEIWVGKLEKCYERMVEKNAGLLEFVKEQKFLLATYLDTSDPTKEATLIVGSSQVATPH